jgi:hypothetical protein
MTDKSKEASMSEIKQAVLAEIMPTEIWIENDILGQSSVVLQHKGCDPFTYATFHYGYGYTSNSSVKNEAKKLAVALGASENVEFRNKEISMKMPTVEQMRFSISLYEREIEKILAEGGQS